MADYDVNFYDSDPSSILTNGIGSTFSWTGGNAATGTATITDNETGIQGATLQDDSNGETATANVTINGLTSSGASVNANQGWTVRDTVTGEEFEVVEFSVREGDAQGRYTLSERPLVEGRTYEVLDYDGSPNPTNDEPVFTYAQYVPPCYAPGTLINTPNGPRAVELLQPGDLVLTLDHGPVPIRWVRSGDHPLEEVEVDARPVLIAAGALGVGLPTQALIVSPQHRILVGGGGQLQRQFKTEAFAPAKSLIFLRGIRHMKGKSQITWIHFACDRHEVVTANGCLSESLLLGTMVVNGLTGKERRALTDIFGPATSQDAALNGPPARTCLKVGEVHHLLAQYSKEKSKSTATEIRKWDRDLAMEKLEAERMHDNQSPGQSSQTASRVAWTKADIGASEAKVNLVPQSGL